MGYAPGDLESLCEISETIIRAYEYWIKSRRKSLISVPYQQKLNQWFKTVFENQTCLVLKHKEKFFSYTRKYVLKQLRGSHLHSDQHDRNDKDEAFRAFVFEEEGPSHFEFAVTHNWIYTGGLYYKGGNTDSKNPMDETVNLNGRNIKLTTLESLVLNIAAEFWFTWQKGNYLNKGRVLIDDTEEGLIKRFGKRIGQECFKTVKWHHEMRKNNENA